MGFRMAGFEVLFERGSWGLGNEKNGWMECWGDFRGKGGGLDVGIWDDFGGMGGWESGVVDGGRSYGGLDVCMGVCGVGVAGWVIV